MARRFVYAPPFGYGLMMYQPLNTVVLPLVLPDIHTPPRAPVSIIVQDTQGNLYYAEDIGARDVKWVKLR